MSEAHPSAAAAVTRTDIGVVTVYFGDKNGKYPDGNQVIVRAPTCARPLTHRWCPTTSAPILTASTW
jgi:hypothetical protein